MEPGSELYAHYKRTDNQSAYLHNGLDPTPAVEYSAPDVATADRFCTYPLLVWEAEHALPIHLDELKPAVPHPEAEMRGYIGKVLIVEIEYHLFSLLTRHRLAASSTAVVELLAAVPLEESPVPLFLVCHFVFGQVCSSAIRCPFPGCA